MEVGSMVFGKMTVFMDGYLHLTAVCI